MRIVDSLALVDAAAIIHSEGEIMVSIDIPTGPFDRSKYEAFLLPGETVEYANVRVLPKVSKPIQISKPPLKTGANADWQPSREERERILLERHLKKVTNEVTLQMERRLSALTSVPPQLAPEVIEAPQAVEPETVEPETVEPETVEAT